MTSQKTSLLFLAAAMLLVISCAPKDDSNVTISGAIANNRAGKLILSLEEDINRKQIREIAEIPVDSSGKFELKLDLEPGLYTVDFYGKKKVTLAIDRGQNILLNADANDWAKISVSGSPDTEKLEAYEAFRKKSLATLVTPVREDITKLQSANDSMNKGEINRLTDLEIENFNLHKDELIAFVEKEMGTSIAVYATSLRWDGEKNLSSLERIVSEFEKARGKLLITKQLREKLRILQNTSLGGTAPEIKMPDKDNVEKSLFAVRGKFTLIDFWGSWCGPCRRESEELSALYLKYKPLGFEILSVGLESDKDLWLQAVEQDKRIWTNVSTVQEFETPAAFDYAVTSLPANFLIDSDGKIIGKNLHGAALRGKIDELLKTSAK